MLEIKDLCKRYADKQALDHVSLTVGPGEIVGLFGENGAGKTTLMKCILSLIRYNSGSVTLDGAAITRANIGRSPSPPASTASSPPFRPRRTGNFMRSILRRSFPAALRG